MLVKQNGENRIKSQLVTLVCGVIASSSNLVLEHSTKEIFSPNSDATLLKYLLVPEAEDREHAENTMSGRSALCRPAHSQNETNSPKTKCNQKQVLHS